MARRGLLCLLLLAPAMPAAAQDAAGETTQQRVLLRGRVVDTAAVGAYVDLGRDRGVRVNDEGFWSRDGQELGRVRVRVATATSCLVEVLDAAGDQAPRVGDQVELRVVPPPKEEPGAGEGDEEEFVPLLARPAVSQPDSARWNGFLRASRSQTRDQDLDATWTTDRLSTAGSGERLGGGPWSLTWSGDAYRFDGSGFDGDRDEGDIKIAMDELVLRRHFDDGSSLHLGRVLPLALPGLGRVDGVLGEVLVDEGFRVGAMTGLRPDPEDLGLAQDDVVLGGYASWSPASDEDLRWWTTAGVLATFFEGEADQHALLLDSRLDLAGRHSLWFSSQADWYTGSEDTRDGVGLSRAGLSASTTLTDHLFLRGSVHHFELPDTLAWRELIPDDARYGRGHRRAAVSLREVVSTWAFEQEVAHLTGESTPSDYQYTLRVQKNSLPGNGFLDVAVFNLVGPETDGLGGVVTWGVLTSRAWSLLASWQTTMAEVDLGGTQDLDHSTLSLSADWRISDAWWVSARAFQTMGDATDATGIQLSLTWRF